HEVEAIIKNMKPSTCALDPFPTALVKSNTGAISALITSVINHYLQSAHVPSPVKTAVIKPLMQTAAAAPSSPESLVFSSVFDVCSSSSLQTPRTDSTVRSIQYSREFLLDKEITTKQTIDAPLAEVLSGFGIRSTSPSPATYMLNRRRSKRCERKQKRGKRGGIRARLARRHPS
ncbi:hypothetical protein NQZ68_019258, partial [Dissostichus eleginoides]